MVFTIQGAPGAGKSSLGVQLAAHAAVTYGSRVYMQVPDEGTRSACVRLGQHAGIDRDLLELTKPDGIDALDDAYRTGLINLVDADAPEAVLETFLEQIAEEHRPGDPPPIFYADSVQTIRTDLDTSFEGKRFQIAYVMESLVAATRALPMIVILVSHVNRPAFAAKKDEDRIDPLAAAAEAAEITRASDALLDLSGDLHDPNGVRAWLRKNRLHRGEKPKTRIFYNIPRGGFMEGDVAAAQERKDAADFEAKQARDASRKAEHEKTVASTAGEVERRLRKAARRLSQRQLHELVGGKFEILKDALRSLEAPGVVDWVEGKKGAILWGIK